jgi:hypothetical protein
VQARTLCELPAWPRRSRLRRLDFAPFVFCGILLQACSSHGAQGTAKKTDSLAKPDCILPTVVKGVVGVLLLWETLFFRMVIG